MERKNLYQLIREQMEVIEQQTQTIQNLTKQALEQDSLIEFLMEGKEYAKSGQ